MACSNATPKAGHPSVPSPPAGAPSCPILIAKVHFMAGNVLRAENGSWMLDESATPLGDPHRPTLVMENNKE